MKFPIKPVGNVQIMGITRVVETTVRLEGHRIINNRIVGGQEVKQEGTFIWSKKILKKNHVTTNEWRWIKFPWGWLDDKDHILGGKSLIQMHQHILHAMFRGDTEVWFHGETCNIKVNLTIREHNIEESKRKKRITLIGGMLSGKASMNDVFNEIARIIHGEIDIIRKGEKP